MQEVHARNELIAAQESLLNVYRCRFDVDTQIVPGGCEEGMPVQGPIAPDSFDGPPTPGDVSVRDGLIAAQEALLNDYRCLFRIDMSIVPGGCHRLAVVSNGAIWTMNGDGTDLVELVAALDPEEDDEYSHSSIWDISWSPDGKRIAYSLSLINQGHSVRSQLWIISSDGDDHTLVHDTGEHEHGWLHHITWSPSGSQLYYVARCCALQPDGDSYRLSRIGADGTNMTSLANAASYSWSPDHSQIVFRKLVERASSDGGTYMTSQLWVMDASGGGQRKIRDDGASFGPVWSPDGSGIAIETISVDSSGGRSKELSVFNAEGGFRRLLDNIPYELAHPNDSRKIGFSWSPGGDQIAYVDYRDSEDILTLVGVDGSSKLHLSPLGRATSFPVWSLDGTRIAFAPGEAEPYKDGIATKGGGLFTISPEGTNLRRLTPKDWRISEIAWSPTR